MVDHADKWAKEEEEKEEEEAVDEGADDALAQQHTLQGRRECRLGHLCCVLARLVQSMGQRPARDVAHRVRMPLP